MFRMHKKSKYTASSEEEEQPCMEVFQISVINNEIYFYEDVTTTTIRILCNHVKRLENEMLKMQCDYKLETPPSIYINIHSYGGDVYAGLAAMNTLEKCRVPVVTVVDGFVASAATFILLGGHQRWMREHSQVLIHQIRGESWGKYEDLKDEMQNTEVLMNIIQTIYVDKSDFPAKKIRKIIKKELTMTSQQCLDYGIVDTIM
jgi:ATP-dependent Clp protease protease subunit